MLNLARYGAAMFWGVGDDGDGTISGVEGMLQDRCYRNLLVPSGAILRPQGHVLRVAETLFLGGLIDASGADGVADIGGEGAYMSPWTPFEKVDGASAGLSAGGAGGNSMVPNSRDGLGGHGGAGGAGSNGSAGPRGEGLDPATATNRIFTFPDAVRGLIFDSAMNMHLRAGGAGGGSGAGNGTDKGGAGGGPGGIMILAAKRVVLMGGEIRACGGDGANGAASGCGGGGGGGGGFIFLICEELSGDESLIKVDGGALGLGVGAGASGAAGAAGTKRIFVLSA